jgi:hypothetical protein
VRRHVDQLHPKQAPATEMSLQENSSNETLQEWEPSTHAHTMLPSSDQREESSPSTELNAQEVEPSPSRKFSTSAVSPFPMAPVAGDTPSPDAITTQLSGDLEEHPSEPEPEAQTCRRSKRIKRKPHRLDL